jgi:hypothetical protein
MTVLNDQSQPAEPKLQGDIDDIEANPGNTVVLGLSTEDSKKHAIYLESKLLEDHDYLTLKQSAQKVIGALPAHPEAFNESDPLLRRQIYTKVDRPTESRASFMTQFSYLLGRALRNLLRNPMLFQVRLSQAAFVGVLLGLIYRDISSRNFDQQAQDIPGVLFFLALVRSNELSFGLI